MDPERVEAGLRGFRTLASQERADHALEMGGFLLADAANAGVLARAGWLSLELFVRQLLRFRGGQGGRLALDVLQWLHERRGGLPAELADCLIEVPEELLSGIRPRVEWSAEACGVLACFFDLVLAQPAVVVEALPEYAYAHSDDFRSIVWDGKSYTFTPMQAACMRVLWENWKRGTPEVGEQSILVDERVATPQLRLSQVFDKGKHPAWGSVIVPGATKGSSRLAESMKKTAIPTGTPTVTPHLD